MKYRKNEVIVRLQGGLGNQMFQFATGLCLAKYNKVDLVLDLSAYHRDKLRVYGLQCFYLDDRKDVNIIHMYKSNLSIQLHRLFYRLFRFNYGNHVVQNGMNYDESLYLRDGSIYLDGYWQSEKFFKGIEKLVKEIFTLKMNLTDQPRIILSQIESSNSVMVHVRRGDYVSDIKNNNKHGALGFDYYNRAINLLEIKINSPTYFVFSDEVDWVKNNFEFSEDKKIVYVSYENATQYTDMMLMQKCKHFVIANSSFSWWAAWLAEFKDKEIIAPEMWFADSFMNDDALDIVPENWHRT